MAQSKYMNECLLCGEKYPYCGHCSDDRYDAWRDVACCWSHYVFLRPIIEYKRKTITKSEAKEQISEAEEIYGKVNMISSVKKTYDEINQTETLSGKKRVKKNMPEKVE